MGLLSFLGRAHQAGIVGLRFRPEAIVPLGGREWTWLAPDLHHPDALGEAPERVDQRELAKAFSAWCAPPLAGPLSQCLGSLLSPAGDPHEVWRQCGAALGLQWPTPRFVAPLPTTPWRAEREALGAWHRRALAEGRPMWVSLSHDPGVDPSPLLEALRGELQSPVHLLPARGPEAWDALWRWVGWDQQPPPERPTHEALRALVEAWSASLAHRAPCVLIWWGVDPTDPWWEQLFLALQQGACEQGALVVALLAPGHLQCPPMPKLHLRQLEAGEHGPLLAGLLPGLPLSQEAVASAEGLAGGSAIDLTRLAQHWLATGLKREPGPEGRYRPKEAQWRLVVPEEAQAVVDCLATLGGRATWGPLCAVLDMPEGPRWEAITRALVGGWVRELPGGLALWGPDEAERVLAACKPTDRQRWHRRVATLPQLGPAQRAHHALEGGLAPLVPKAVLQARPCLAALGATEALGTWLEQAWRLADLQDPLRPELAEARFRLALDAGDPELALSLAEKPSQEALALAQAGRVEEALARVAQASLPPSEELGLAIAWAHAQRGEPEACRRALAQLPDAPEEGLLSARWHHLQAWGVGTAAAWAVAWQSAQAAGLPELTLLAWVPWAQALWTEGQAERAAEELDALWTWALRHQLELPPEALLLQHQLTPPSPAPSAEEPTTHAPDGPGHSALPQASLPGTRGALRALLKAEGQWELASLGQLEAVLALVASRWPREVLLERLAATFLKVGGLDRAWVFLTEEGGQLRLRHQVGAEGGVQPPSTLCEALASEGALFHAKEGSQHPRLQGEAPEAGGVLALPLVARDALAGNRLLGLLYGDRQKAWGDGLEGSLAWLELLARHVGVALEASLLEDEALRRAHRLEALLELSTALAKVLDLDEVANLALARCLSATRAEQGYLFWGPDLPCRASVGPDGQVLTQIEASRSVLTQVQAEGRSLAILDVPREGGLDPKASLVAFRVRSVLAVPIKQEEQVEGVLYLSSSSATKTFGREDLELVEAMAGQIALALQAARAFAVAKEANLGLEAKVQARTAELEEAYRGLSEAQDQLLETEKLATVGSLAAGVAHEINNPLGAILTNAQLLLLDAEDEELKDGLQLIEAGAKRCQTIVEALRRYARPPSPERNAVDLLALAQEVLHFLAIPLQQSGVQVTLEAPPRLPSALGDATELRQLLTQLVLNALDAINEAARAEAGQLTLRLDAKPEGLRVLVQDNGVGIPQDLLRRIFDPFFTTKPVGSATGLGLSLAQRIAEKHGGRLLVSSREGQGTEFQLQLPLP